MSYPAVVWLSWLVVWVVALVAVMVIVGVCALASSPSTERSRPARERRDAIRASRRFADLIASGDFDAAEATARKAFAGAGDRRVVECDLRVLLDLSLERARRELTEPASVATWFPEIRRVAHGDEVELVLGGDDPVRLTVVSERWVDDLDGVVFETSGEAFSIRGSLSLRTVVTGTDPSPRLETAVEVLVHMETIDDPEARRAIARARRITSDGLSRMAATFRVDSP